MKITSKRWRDTSRKLKLKGAIGLLLIALFIAGSIYWENIGREALTQSGVLVAAEKITAGDKITADKLGMLQMSKDNLSDDRISNPDLIIGKIAAIDIPARTQLFKSFFTTADRLQTTGDDLYNYRIPSDWIISFPQSLRRGDKISVYPFAGYDDVIYSEQPLDTAQPLLILTVNYVKDGSNREVIDMGAHVRYDGSAVADHIEVLISDNEYNILAAAVSAGYRLNIMYD